MVHILAARRTCQYAAGQGFHSQRPYSIMGLSSRTVFFLPHHIIYTLPCVPLRAASPFCLTFVYNCLPRLLYVALRTPHTIPTSCSRAIPRQITGLLSYFVVYCSLTTIAVCIVNRLHPPIVHIYALVVPLIMSHHIHCQSVG